MPFSEKKRRFCLKKKSDFFSNDLKFFMKIVPILGTYLNGENILKEN